MLLDRPANALLRSLSDEDWRELGPYLQRLDLQLGATLYETEDVVRWVIFPEVGLLSVITIMASGVEIETSVVGREGSVGFVEALGSGRLQSRLIVQVPGHAYRLSPSVFRDLFRKSPAMQQAVQQQVELLLAEARQAIACHTVHKLEARFSRWLLECADLAGAGETLPLTQTFLAAMLAVQRTTVSTVANDFQARGLIQYQRGSLVLLDRPGLEACACECRATLQHLRSQLAPETFAYAPIVKA